MNDMWVQPALFLGSALVVLIDIAILQGITTGNRLTRVALVDGLCLWNVLLLFAIARRFHMDMDDPHVRATIDALPFGYFLFSLLPRTLLGLVIPKQKSSRWGFGIAMALVTAPAAILCIVTAIMVGVD